MTDHTSPSTHLPKTITFVYPVGSDPSDYPRAVVACPKTYEDAIKAAIDALGCYMREPLLENYILRCLVKSLTKDMKSASWVWGDIVPAHWGLVLASCPSEIGIFKRFGLKKPMFLHGMLWITVGTTNGQKTEWQKLETNRTSTWQQIDRPKNYAEAVSIVKHYESIKSETSKKFTFYHVLDEQLKAWTAFPPEAYKNEKVWQDFVPLPGGILGVQIS